MTTHGKMNGRQLRVCRDWYLDAFAMDFNPDVRIQDINLSNLTDYEDKLSAGEYDAIEIGLRA